MVCSGCSVGQKYLFLCDAIRVGNRWTFAEEDDVKLGGNVGDALAASSLVTKRVCYELNGETGKIDFVGKEKMAQLLENIRTGKKPTLKKDSQKRSIP